MKSFPLSLCLLLSASLASAMDPQMTQRGKQEEQRACTPCHSLRLVHSQRLSATAWQKEIDKMIAWGAPVSDRKLLLDYLSHEYNAEKPLPPDELTGNGVFHKK
jgi:hypothetical protein